MWELAQIGSEAAQRLQQDPEVFASELDGRYARMAFSRDLTAAADMSGIPTADSSWIDVAAGRFERAWHSGARARIEDYVAEVDESRRPALMEELFRVEIELRRRDGEEPTAEEYRRRFPENAALVDAVFTGPGAGRSSSSGESSASSDISGNARVSPSLIRGVLAGLS